MWNRTVVRNALGAAAILAGLTAPAVAQQQPPGAGGGYYNGWNTYYDNDRGYYRGGSPNPGGSYYRGGTVGAGGGGPDSYCTRFRSFDPASGTYRGRDGRRHPCP
jgi:uncharacterized membrane protein